MSAKNYDSVDLMKLILCIIVVTLHVNPFGGGYHPLKPIDRIAVPFFFITSSYFFFSAFIKKENKYEKRVQLHRYIIRNMQLYISWFIILLPVTFHVRGYLQIGLIEGIKQFVLDFLFSNTFMASWYIMASIIGMIIVCCLTKYIGNKWTLLFGIFIYLVCCLESNYKNLCDDFISLFEWYHGKIYNSFPVSIIWILFGKIIAEKRKYICEKIKTKQMIIILICSLFLLYIEYLFIKHIRAAVSDDCYFMLFFVCPCSYIIVLQWSIHFGYAYLCRKFSTITYCLHSSMGKIVSSVCIFLPDSFKLKNLIIFLLTLLGCFGGFLIIETIKQRKYFHWVKYLE